MSAWRRRLFRSCGIFGLLVVVGCAASPPPPDTTPALGIEIGNPILLKSIRVIPAGNPYVYLVAMPNREHATLQQLSKALSGGGSTRGVRGTKALTDEAASIVVPIVTVSANRIFIEGTFPNGERITLLIDISDAGEVTALEMEIHGAPVTATFDIEDDPLCTTTSTNVAEQLMNATCGRAIGCVPELTCTDCRDRMLASVEIASAFLVVGGNGLTWQQIVDAAGSLAVNTTAQTTCVAQIGALACADVLTVIGANGTIDFAAATTLIEKIPACPQVLTTK